MANPTKDLTKNPYPTNTPEWQLCENMLSYEAQSRAFADDAQRFQKRSQDARETADTYRTALAKLDPSVAPPGAA